MNKLGGQMRSPVTELEQDILQVIWEEGSATTEAVHARLSKTRQIKEVSVRTMLRRLEEKGHLRHDVDGRTFVYRAAEVPRNLAARSVRDIIDRFCRGSLEELVTGMLDAKVLSKAELERLRKFVDSHK